MRLLTDHLLIKPLSQYELESLIKAIHDNEGFDIGILNGNDFTWEITQTLEDTYLPAVKKHAENYLLYTIWLIIDKITNHIKGFISFNISPGDKKQLELSFTLFNEAGKLNIIYEALNSTIRWCTNKYNFTQFHLHGDYGQSFEDVFISNGFNKINNGLYNRSLYTK